MAMDLVSIKNSSLSLGANIRFGFENRYGLGYVYLLAILFSGSSKAPQSKPAFGTYAEFPMLMRYNYGYGSSSKTTKKFGFYMGGGINYLITSYVYGIKDIAPASFWGWTAEAGMRFNNYELGVYKTVSISGPYSRYPSAYLLWA